jgi:hypothetical protein
MPSLVNLSSHLGPTAIGDDDLARRVKLDRRCRECGYGIATVQLPAACPMCRGASWEPVTRHPWRELGFGALAR